METLKKTYSEFSADRCPQMAAALSFYTMLSLAPLLVLVVTVASWFMGPKTTDHFVAQAKTLLGQQGGEEVSELIKGGEKEQQKQRSGSSSAITTWVANIASIVLLVFSATGLVGQLQTSLNQAWDVEPDPAKGGVKYFITKRILSLGMILGIAFVLLVSMLLTTALSVLGDRLSQWLGVGEAVHFVISEGTTFLVVLVLFAAMFKFLPDAKIRWRDVFTGALFTAALFTAGKFLLGLYLGNKDMSTAYGQAGSLVLLLLWVYYSAMIFFFGAELTQVWTRRHGRDIEPAEGAVRVVEQKHHVREPHAGGNGIAADRREPQRTA